MKADCLTTTDAEVPKHGEQTGFDGRSRCKQWLLGVWGWNPWFNSKQCEEPYY